VAGGFIFPAVKMENRINEFFEEIRECFTAIEIVNATFLLFVKRAPSAMVVQI